VVGTGRFERPTYRLGGGCSIHLSYVPTLLNYDGNPSGARSHQPALETFPSNVAPDLPAVEADLLHGFIDVGDRFGQSGAGVRHAQHAPAVGDKAFPSGLRGGVKDRGARGFGCIDASDDIAAAHLARVACSGKDDADRGVLAKGEVTLVDATGRGAGKERPKVAFHAVQKGLRLGIAEADVVLKDLRPAGGHHQPGVKEPRVG
jgi:hypothetical protein